MLATTSLLFGLFASPVSAGEDGPVVFNVDNVEDLYDAVAVSGAIVNLAPGEYLLDPSAPNDGRLDLADGVDLRGPSSLSTGPHGLPDVDGTGAPVFHKDGEPAVIDGSDLSLDTFGKGMTASFRANRVVDVAFNGLLIAGGLSGDDNVVSVDTSDNVIQSAGIGMFVETRGGGGLDSDPSDIRGASRNHINFTSTRDSFDGVEGAYLISGAIREYLFDPDGGPPLIGGESNDNTIVGTIHKAKIENAFFFDIVAEAATTAVFPPPGDAPVSGYNNVVTLTLRGIQGSSAPFNVFVADSTPIAPGSGNDVVITRSRNHNEKANSGLDFTAVPDGDFSK